MNYDGHRVSYEFIDRCCIHNSDGSVTIDGVRYRRRLNHSPSLTSILEKLPDSEELME